MQKVSMQLEVEPFDINCDLFCAMTDVGLFVVFNTPPHVEPL